MKMSSEIQVERVSWERLREVRFEVLWPHLKSSDEARLDIDESEGALHLAAFLGEEIVGVVSVFNQKCERYPELFIGEDTVRIRAMGVLEKARGLKVGVALVREVEKRSGVKHQVVWCDAREVAWGFYEKCGFLFASDKHGVELSAYLVPDVGIHKMMYKRL